jgi:Gpi18-like mannosyltransferase
MSSLRIRNLILRLPPRALKDRSVRAAAFTFALTRIILLVIFVLTAHLTLGQPSFGGAVQEPRISIDHADISQKLQEIVESADSNWYKDIARLGYEAGPFMTDRQHSWAFFPLFPIILRAAASVTGEYPLTGVALSNLFFLLGLILLHRTVLELGHDEKDAGRTIFYMAVFPTSYFFSLPLTESLFLCLTVGSFYAAKRDAWWMAGLLGALASATRVNGVLLLPVLALLYLERYRRAGLSRNVLGLLLIPAGLLAYMLYLYRLTGNALAFKDAQVRWDRGTGMFWRPLVDYVKHFREIGIPWNFKLLNFAAAMLAFGCALVLIKRREWALALFTLLAVIMPLSSLSLQGLDRYVMVVFPIFLVLALAGRRPLLDQTIRTVFIALMALMAALFAARFSLAMV